MNTSNDIINSSLGGSPPVLVAPRAKQDTAASVDVPLQMAAVPESLLGVVARSRENRALLGAIAQVIAEHMPTELIFYFGCDHSNRALPGVCLRGDASTVPGTLGNSLFAHAEATRKSRRADVHRLEDDGDLLVLSVPICLSEGRVEVLAVIVSGTFRFLERALSVVEMAATHVMLWHAQQNADDAKSEAQSTAALQELLQTLEASPNLENGCGALVDGLQQYLECHRVALAICAHQHGRGRLQAISGAQRFDKHSSFVSAVESALDEAILRDTLTVWPPLSPGDRHAALAHHKLCAVADAPCVVSSPLRDTDGAAIGAWLFLGTRQCFERPRVLDFIRASEPRIASSLSLLKRAEGGPLARLWQFLFRGKRSWQTKGILLALCAAIGIMFVPLHYKIRCDCQLEPVLRRFVAAPYDGILKRVLVTSGATVRKGEVLARMDDREIRWELAGIIAERERALKQSDAAFANHKFAAAKVAGLEKDRLELTMKLLEQRQKNLDIKSPIDGVVTVGDLEKAEGAPVTCGQTLFEIAPLTKMVVEIAIPESEVSYVRKNQKVTIYFEAAPSMSYHATISKIHPRSEIREQQNVFVAEVMLPNAEGTLRPGMHGRAKIIGPRRPLGWNLFHKPWESLCMMIGW